MGIKLVTRLCLALSHLGEQKFKHSFQDTVKPLLIAGWTSSPPPTFYSNIPRISAKDGISNDQTIFQRYLKLTCNF